MSAFKVLRDVSKSFEEELQRFSGELFAANVGENFEDGIAKKLRDLSLLTSKLRLLQAKPLAVSPQVANQHIDEHRLTEDYADTVKDKLLECQVVKTVTQSHAVKALITANDRDLDPEMMDRKEKIYSQLTKYKEKERELLELDKILKERHNQLHEVRREWDSLLGHLRQVRVDDAETSREDSRVKSKLQVLMGKTRLIRALLGRLAASRGGGYDWLADPQRRLRALQLSRQ